MNLTDQRCKKSLAGVSLLLIALALAPLTPYELKGLERFLSHFLHCFERSESGSQTSRFCLSERYRKYLDCPDRYGNECNGSGQGCAGDRADNVGATDEDVAIAIAELEEVDRR